ncbi:hypothetical protein ACOMHN_030602 [Nucella lapillus]
MHPLPSQHRHASTAQPTPPCIHCPANTAMHPLPSQHRHASTAQPTPPCIHCPQLHAIKADSFLSQHRHASTAHSCTPSKRTVCSANTAMHPLPTAARHQSGQFAQPTPPCIHCPQLHAIKADSFLSQHRHASTAHSCTPSKRTVFSANTAMHPLPTAARHQSGQFAQPTPPCIHCPQLHAIKADSLLSQHRHASTAHSCTPSKRTVFSANTAMHPLPTAARHQSGQFAQPTPPCIHCPQLHAIKADSLLSQHRHASTAHSCTPSKRTVFSANTAMHPLPTAARHQSGQFAQPTPPCIHCPQLHAIKADSLLSQHRHASTAHSCTPSKRTVCSANTAMHPLPTAARHQSGQFAQPTPPCIHCPQLHAIKADSLLSQHRHASTAHSCTPSKRTVCSANTAMHPLPTAARHQSGQFAQPTPPCIHCPQLHAIKADSLLSQHRHASTAHSCTPSKRTVFSANTAMHPLPTAARHQSGQFAQPTPPCIHCPQLHAIKADSLLSQHRHASTAHSCTPSKGTVCSANTAMHPLPTAARHQSGQFAQPTPPCIHCPQLHAIKADSFLSQHRHASTAHSCTPSKRTVFSANTAMHPLPTAARHQSGQFAQPTPPCIHCPQLHAIKADSLLSQHRHASTAHSCTPSKRRVFSANTAMHPLPTAARHQSGQFSQPTPPCIHCPQLHAIKADSFLSQHRHASTAHSCTPSKRTVFSANTAMHPLPTAARHQSGQFSQPTPPCIHCPQLHAIKADSLLSQHRHASTAHSCTPSKRTVFSANTAMHPLPTAARHQSGQFSQPTPPCIHCPQLHAIKADSFLSQHRHASTAHSCTPSKRTVFSANTAMHPLRTAARHQSGQFSQPTPPCIHCPQLHAIKADSLLSQHRHASTAHSCTPSKRTVFSANTAMHPLPTAARHQSGQFSQPTPPCIHCPQLHAIKADSLLSQHRHASTAHSCTPSNRTVFSANTAMHPLPTAARHQSGQFSQPTPPCIHCPQLHAIKADSFLSQHRHASTAHSCTPSKRTVFSANTAMHPLPTAARHQSGQFSQPTPPCIHCPQLHAIKADSFLSQHRHASTAHSCTPSKRTVFSANTAMHPLPTAARHQSGQFSQPTPPCIHCPQLHAIKADSLLSQHRHASTAHSCTPSKRTVFSANTAMHPLPTAARHQSGQFAQPTPPCIHCPQLHAIKADSLLSQHRHASTAHSCTPSKRTVFSANTAMHPLPTAARHQSGQFSQPTPPCIHCPQLHAIKADSFLSQHRHASTAHSCTPSKRTVCSANTAMHPLPTAARHQSGQFAQPTPPCIHCPQLHAIKADSLLSQHRHASTAHSCTPSKRTVCSANTAMHPLPTAARHQSGQFAQPTPPCIHCPQLHAIKADSLLSQHRHASTAHSCTPSKRTVCSANTAMHPLPTAARHQSGQFAQPTPPCIHCPQLHAIKADSFLSQHRHASTAHSCTPSKRTVCSANTAMHPLHTAARHQSGQFAQPTPPCIHCPQLHAIKADSFLSQHRHASTAHSCTPSKRTVFSANTAMHPLPTAARHQSGQFSQPTPPCIHCPQLHAIKADSFLSQHRHASTAHSCTPSKRTVFSANTAMHPLPTAARHQSGQFSQPTPPCIHCPQLHAIKADSFLSQHRHASTAHSCTPSKRTVCSANTAMHPLPTAARHQSGQFSQPTPPCIHCPQLHAIKADSFLSQHRHASTAHSCTPSKRTVFSANTAMHPLPTAARHQSGQFSQPTPPCIHCPQLHAIKADSFLSQHRHASTAHSCTPSKRTVFSANTAMHPLPTAARHQSGQFSQPTPPCIHCPQLHAIKADSFLSQHRHASTAHSCTPSKRTVCSANTAMHPLPTAARHQSGQFSQPTPPCIYCPQLHAIKADSFLSQHRHASTAHSCTPSKRTVFSANTAMHPLPTAARHQSGQFSQPTPPCIHCPQLHTIKADSFLSQHRHASTAHSCTPSKRTVFSANTAMHPLPTAARHQSGQFSQPTPPCIHCPQLHAIKADSFLSQHRHASTAQPTPPCIHCPANTAMHPLPTAAANTAMHPLPTAARHQSGQFAQPTPPCIHCPQLHAIKADSFLSQHRHASTAHSCTPSKRTVCSANTAMHPLPTAARHQSGQFAQPTPPCIHCPQLHAIKADSLLSQHRHASTAHSCTPSKRTVCSANTAMHPLPTAARHQSGQFSQPTPPCIHCPQLHAIKADSLLSQHRHASTAHSCTPSKRTVCSANTAMHPLPTAARLQSPQ